MKTYEVLVARDRTESAYVTVTAVNAVEARNRAMAGADDDSLAPEWELDEPQGAHVIDCKETR